MGLYTIHRPRGKNLRDLRAIGDRFSTGALLFLPLWLIWHGMWVMLGLWLGLLVGVVLTMPIAFVPVFVGCALIAAFEGGALRRLELRLRGWVRADLLEAQSEAGAEEIYLTKEQA